MAIFGSVERELAGLGATDGAEAVGCQHVEHITGGDRAAEPPIERLGCPPVDVALQMSQPGAASPKLQERIGKLGLENFAFSGFPVTFWDVFGEQGHPVRATVSEMGPLLLARLLNLNETQAGVLTLVFKIADDNGLLLLDFKDLRSMVRPIPSRISALSKGGLVRLISTPTDSPAAPSWHTELGAWALMSFSNGKVTS